MIQKQIIVNGVPHNIFVDQDTSLAKVLREQLHLLGTKVGCGEGHCGACNVIIDGKLTRSCIVKMKRLQENAKILTIEGIGTPANLHTIQKAWIKHGGAQCGYCTPGFIVSAKALLDENPNPSRDDVRNWFQKNRNVCRCTGYIHLIDAVVEAAKVLKGDIPADSLDYKLPADGHIWGIDSKYPRPTAVGKVTGTLKYGGDLSLELPPDRLCLVLVQATVSHANIKSIDVSEAEKMPGVAKVITHKDVKGNNRINGLAFPTNKGDGKDRPILCDTKVFQYGDAIAIVAAATEAEGKAAAAKVKVDLEPLPPYLSVPAAKAPDALEIHPGTPNVYYTQKHKKGEDTKPIFDRPDVVIAEDTIITSRTPHMPLEADCAFGYINDEGEVIVHSKSIGVHLHQLMIMEGVGAKKLHIVCNPMGGTFGYKFSPTNEALVAVSVMATSRPCYLVFDYHQQMQYTGKRSPFYGTVRLAADKSGKLLGMETDYDIDHGPYSEFGDLLTLRGVQFMGAAYDIPNIRGEGRAVCTNHAWGSAFRGYGGTQAQLISEIVADELAAKLNMDPWEFRYKNVHRPGTTNPSGQVLDSYSYVEMMEAIKPKYEAALKKAKAESTATHKKGVGLACGSYGCGLDGPDSSNAYVELHPDSTITVCTAWEDHGQGADMGAVGTAHQALRPMNVSPERLKFTWADTRNPVSGPAGGSRSQVMTGGAIKAACENMLAGLKKADGTYYTYKEAVDAGVAVKYDGTFSVPGVPIDENAIGKPFMVYMYGVCLSEVTVELATGKTVVDKVTFNVDIGKVNNRLIVDGQLYGGVAQAIGLALREDFEDIQKHKTMLAGGIPYALDIPDNIEINYFEYPREFGPFGASGVGEIPLCVPHPSILNAIYNATGARVKRIPANPERVLAALKEKD
ncbi:MAG: molybdopterin-dependent oxidoreductase [Deltaproteobacteria bacterium]|jgi:aldehyde oxidoreductase|nr:molybdopterin-dependent oxidoreductase [Deltaproteobacteria bacterium]